MKIMIQNHNEETDDLSYLFQDKKNSNIIVSSENCVKIDKIPDINRKFQVGDLVKCLLVPESKRDVSSYYFSHYDTHFIIESINEPLAHGSEYNVPDGYKLTDGSKGPRTWLLEYLELVKPCPEKSQ